jgi:hypothetical protein
MGYGLPDLAERISRPSTRKAAPCPLNSVDYPRCDRRSPCQCQAGGRCRSVGPHWPSASRSQRLVPVPWAFGPCISPRLWPLLCPLAGVRALIRAQSRLLPSRVSGRRRSYLRTELVRRLAIINAVRDELKIAPTRCQRRRENVSAGRSKTASRRDAKCPHGTALAARQTE